VQQDGQHLQYIPDALKTEEICLEALRSQGDVRYKYCYDLSPTALEYVPDALKTEKICIEAMKHSLSSSYSRYGQTVSRTHPLELVPEKLKTEAVCLAAAQKDAGALEFVPKALKTKAFEAKIRDAMISSGISSGSGGSGYGINLI
jgi:hypothetical protein